MASFTNPPVLDILDEPSMFADDNSYNQKNHNWYELRQYGSEIGVWLAGVMDGYDTRFNNMIANSEQVNEVVDARVDSDNVVYPTLKARIDNLDTAKISKIDGTEINGLRTMVLTDLSADSGNVRLGAQTQINDDFNNPLQEGYMETSTTRITVSEVSKISD